MLGQSPGEGLQHAVMSAATWAATWAGHSSGTLHTGIGQRTMLPDDLVDYHVNQEESDQISRPGISTCTCTCICCA